MMAVFDEGKRLTALTRSSVLTFPFLLGSFLGARTTGHVEGARTEATRVLGVELGSLRAAL